MDEERLEAVRDVFFKATNIDLENLTAKEARGLLELLPQAMTYLFERCNLPAVFAADEDDSD